MELSEFVYHAYFKNCGMITTTDHNVVTTHQQNDELHRIDGPAWIKYLGDKVVIESWFLDNLQHREDGPAWILYDKDGTVNNCEYHLKGMKKSKEDWDQHCMKLKLAIL